jgi:hypothetical protein
MIFVVNSGTRVSTCLRLEYPIISFASVEKHFTLSNLLDNSNVDIVNYHLN